MSGFELLPILMGGLSAAGTVASGVAANNNAKYEAQQMDMRAKEEVASSQRDAIAKRREGDLINSRAQALAAASGGGAGSDAPTIIKLMSQTTGESEYNAQTSMYGGQSRAAGLMDSAKGRRAQGKSTLLGSVFSGFGQAAKGFG